MKKILVIGSVLLFIANAAIAAEQPQEHNINLSQAEAVIAQDNNAFAIALYKQLSNEHNSHPDGFFFSPISISIALSMASAEARGETATEMAKTLHASLSFEQLHPAMAKLLHDLNAAHDGYQLQTANALWVQNDYHLLDGFINIAKDSYSATLQPVDFKAHAGQIINKWIEEHTGNMLAQTVNPDSFATPSLATLVLINTMYFKGDWETPFDESQTRNEPYQQVNKSSIWSRSSVRMMHVTGNFRHYDGGTFQMVEIPYKGKEASMIIFLPHEADGLAKFEESMTALNMEMWFSQLRESPKVVVNLPRFKTIRVFELDNVLGHQMGMQQAFNPRLADFSAATDKKDLFIHYGENEGYLVTNEKGTKAATETIVAEEQPTFVVGPPTSSTVFHANHPFVFLVRDNRSGAILFMGRVNNPTGD